MEDRVEVDDGDRGPYHPPLAPADIAAVVEFSLRAWAPVFESFRTVLGNGSTRRSIPTGQPVRLAPWMPSAKTTPQRCGWPNRRGVPSATSPCGSTPTVGQARSTCWRSDPLVQRQGIGTALTSFAVQRLGDAGMRLAVVGTGGDPGHAPARRVYEEAGFVGLPLVRYYARLDTGGDLEGSPTPAEGT
jgi:hypothetical protein